MMAEDSIDKVTDGVDGGADDSIGISALTRLFLLEHEFRRAPSQAHLAQLVIRRLNRFVPYDCAVLWTCNKSGRLIDVAVSKPQSDAASGIAFAAGGAKPKNLAPIMRWANVMAEWLLQQNWGNTQITPDAIAERLLTDWPGDIPISGLYVPLRRHDGQLRGGVLLLRQGDWSRPVRVMLNQLAESIAYTLDAIDAGVHGRQARVRRTWVVLSILALIVSASFFIQVPKNGPLAAALTPPLTFAWPTQPQTENEQTQQTSLAQYLWRGAVDAIDDFYQGEP